MAFSRDEWLEYLLAELVTKDAGRLSLLQQYADGVPPQGAGVVNAGQKFRDFHKKSNTNFADLVVSAVLDRMRLLGFRTGADDDENGDVEARRIMRENNLWVRFADLHRWFLTFGDAYSIVGRNGFGRAVVTTHSPREVITTGGDEPEAALRVYNDPYQANTKVCALWTPGELHVARAQGIANTFPSIDRFSWSAPIRTGFDRVPVTRYVNRGSAGEFEPHLPLLDRIQHMVFQRLIIATTQAFKQRALKGNLPTHDAQGNEIDYNGIFESGPDALWQLPEGVDIWESQQVDMSGILNGTKADIQDLSAVTQTPMFYFIPDGANQSATGAQVAREGATFKALDRIDRTNGSHARTMSLAFETNGDTARAGLLDLEPMWAPVERYSLSERADAASKATDMPFRTKMTDIWQFTPQQVDEMEQERAGDLLLNGAIGGDAVQQAS